jgi:Beta-lactamase class C and other penicillin binding proteins
MTRDSRFVMGKIQDVVNNAVIMHLIDTGKVKLNDKLSKYDKDVAGADLITVKEVMNQTSGLSAADFSATGSAKA